MKNVQKNVSCAPASSYAPAFNFDSTHDYWRLSRWLRLHSESGPGNFGCWLCSETSVDQKTSTLVSEVFGGANYGAVIRSKNLSICWSIFLIVWLVNDSWKLMQYNKFAHRKAMFVYLTVGANIPEKRKLLEEQLLWEFIYQFLPDCKKR